MSAIEKERFIANSTLACTSLGAYAALSMLGNPGTIMDGFAHWFLVPGAVHTFNLCVPENNLLKRIINAPTAVFSLGLTGIGAMGFFYGFADTSLLEALAGLFGATTGISSIIWHTSEAFHENTIPNNTKTTTTFTKKKDQLPHPAQEQPVTPSSTTNAYDANTGSDGAFNA